MNKSEEEVNKEFDSLNGKVTKIINTSIYLLLNKLGVEIDDPNVLETATEAFINYIELIGQISSSIALTAGRTQINLVDVQKAIKCLDSKRYEQIFCEDNNLDNKNFENQFEITNISKNMIPEIHLDGELSWKDLINNNEKQYHDKNNSIDAELFEFLDSTPKHIPEFLPIFPPRLYYCENKLHNNFS